MRIEKQIRFNEWLLGSTILCQSCGCLWLVPAAQKDENYFAGSAAPRCPASQSLLPATSENKGSNT